MAHSRPGFLPLQSHTVPWRASPRPDRGRTGDLRSVGLLFDGGAAQEEAGIAGQRALLFLPQHFIFLRFRCCRFRLWEAKGGGCWRGLRQSLVDVAHLSQDLGRTEPGVPGPQRAPRSTERPLRLLGGGEQT